MGRGNFPGVEKSFPAARLKKDDADDSTDDREKADPRTRTPPRVQPIVITEVAFVALGNLLLRSTRGGHDKGSIIKKSHVGMPRRQHDQQKRNGRVDEEPAMQPMLQFRLQIEHASLVAPGLNLFNPAPMRFGDT